MALEGARTGGRLGLCPPRRTLPPSLALVSVGRADGIEPTAVFFSVCIDASSVHRAPIGVD
jgi:hypothetical protein